MALTTYKKKRRFDKTSEPRGGKPAGKHLRFVIQKHDASRLHYDLRLEMKGVLKSWAIPKGPSIDPSVKRLALQVEDHPYDYRHFEGIIPKGEYGGGTVIIWDEGSYEPIDKTFKDIKAQEAYLLKQLKKGKITVELHGEKLKGNYALVKSSEDDNSWFFMKLKDKHAGKRDITSRNKSVVSGKTIGQVEKIYSTKTSSQKKAAKKKNELNRSSGKKPSSSLTPMLATLVDQPPAEPRWVYEIKWDGYRAMALLQKQHVTLQSRNKRSFNDRFYPVRDALIELNINAVLDGEIVVVNEKGVSDFGSLQNWKNESDGEIRYYVFDLLWLNGHDMLDLPLLQRREMLTHVIPDHPVIRISELFNTTGKKFLKTAAKAGLEGIMAKKEDSVYMPGTRSKDWLKIKISKRHEVVIGGYTLKPGSPKEFSALLAGVYKKNKLQYIGKIGTGFTDSLQKQLKKKFKSLETNKSPFETSPGTSMLRQTKVVWLKPALVTEVSYTELTSEGLMRHPSFKGIREDKAAKEVIEEKSKNVAEMVDKKNREVKTPTTSRKPHSAKDKKLIGPGEKENIINITGKKLKLTNLTKIYWPVEKITKGDLINYYHAIAPYILPYLKDRPHSLHRHPNGIQGKSFYQKNVAGKFPSWISTHDYDNTSGKGKKKFFVCTDEAHLLYMANLGCIEINPWHSRIYSPDNPDWCVIDLDPDNNPFNKVIETANVIHQLLSTAGVKCYPKTSGSTGIHIFIPLGAKYDYEQSKMLAHLIVTLTHRELRKFTSIERNPAKRKGKIYLDYLQNRHTQTIAAPFSVRPKAGATVSMPLAWEEMKPGLKISDFTIQNSIAEARNRKDLFQPVLKKGINIGSVIKKIEKL